MSKTEILAHSKDSKSHYEIWFHASSQLFLLYLRNIALLKDWFLKQLKAQLHCVSIATTSSLRIKVQRSRKTFQLHYKTKSNL